MCNLKNYIIQQAIEFYALNSYFYMYYTLINLFIIKINFLPIEKLGNAP